MEQWILDLVISFLQSNPIFGSVLMIIGVCRLIFKPLMLILGDVVKVTPTSLDDSLLSGFMNSTVYKVIVFVLDYFASVKLPKK